MSLNEIKWKFVLVTNSFSFSNTLQMVLATLPQAFKMVLKILPKIGISHLSAEAIIINILVPSCFFHNPPWFSQMVHKWPLQRFPRLSKQF